MMWRLQYLASLAAVLVLAKRNVVLAGALLLAVFFVANGVYILTKGRIGPRLMPIPQPGKVLPYPSRLALAVLYFAVAIGLALLVWRLGTGVT